MAGYTSAVGCSSSFAGNVSPTFKRPGCRNPDGSSRIVVRPRSPPRALVVQIPGPHPQWGRPTLVEKEPQSQSWTKRDVIEQLLEDQPSASNLTPSPTIYDLPKKTKNPDGWWHVYDQQTPNLNYLTSNSEYARYPPNPYTMPITYFVTDRNFTSSVMEFPIYYRFYRNRSVNVHYI